MSVGSSFGHIPCLFGREEILVILCLHFSKLFAKNWFGPYKNKKLCSSLTSHSAYVATATESDGVKIDGLLPPNFL